MFEKPSPLLHFPGEESLKQIEADMAGLLGLPSYPCIPAVKSFVQGQYLVGTYENYGSGMSAAQMARDLRFYRRRQKSTSSPFLSFWAVYNHDVALDEKENERRLWAELSYLSAHDPKPWAPGHSSDPSNPRFCFSFDEEAFFVVALHPHSSRFARRFPRPAIVFNLMSQFDDLIKTGRYAAVVKGNRQRELKFQGHLNPMVERYGDKWEAIQFSGRSNSPDWTCPFQHLPKAIYA